MEAPRGCSRCAERLTCLASQNCLIAFAGRFFFRRRLGCPRLLFCGLFGGRALFAGLQGLPDVLLEFDVLLDVRASFARADGVLNPG